MADAMNEADVAEAMLPENAVAANDWLPAGVDGEDLERELTHEVEFPTTLQLEKTKTDVPPDGGFGWICVICVWFINAHTWGINATYGVFLSYYLSHDYFQGTSTLSYAFIGGLTISLAVFIAPVATWIIQRFGTRTCLHIGVFLETLSLIAASFARKEYQLILAQGVCFGVGMGFVFVGSVGIVPQWFSSKRSLATAIAASGSGAGGLTYSLATHAMISHLGLPWAFRILGILAFVFNLIPSNILRDRNFATGAKLKPLDFHLLKRPEFILHQLWTFFSMLGYVILLFSLPSYGESIGLSSSKASVVGAILNAGQMIGRPLTGLASDRFGRLNVASFATFLCGLFCLAFWIPAKGMGLLTFFAIIGGSVAGTFWSVVAPVTAEVVGIKDLPSGLSMTWLLMSLPTTFAEVIALQLRKPSGSANQFINAQIFTAIMFIVASVCMWFVRTWKVGDLERKNAAIQHRDPIHHTTAQNGSNEPAAKTAERLPITNTKKDHFDHPQQQQQTDIIIPISRSRNRNKEGTSPLSRGFKFKAFVCRLVAIKHV
ncbi:putative mfs transporter [Phaeomoniella chlamydospora]|uniref:Putative mfs transporter n=1 Tax=Phaeomoniella chlamydospora TaxID=158046 RepID=A0A0G2ESM8_PHACM|nr:putative mfs transporter [Phaeomoniella chlamydospora]